MRYVVFLLRYTIPVEWNWLGGIRTYNEKYQQASARIKCWIARDFICMFWVMGWIHLAQLIFLWKFDVLLINVDRKKTIDCGSCMALAEHYTVYTHYSHGPEIFGSYLPSIDRLEWSSVRILFVYYTNRNEDIFHDSRLDMDFVRWKKKNCD